MPDAARRRFWRRVQWLTAVLLAAWLLLNLSLPWFGRDLANLYGYDFPAAYWLAAEGALGAYLLLIVVYVVAMERLESQLLDEEAAAAGTAPPGEAGAVAGEG